MEIDFFQRKLSEQMWKMEGIIAEAKNHHGLSRARYRRRAKVQIQAYLTATVQNIKRLVRAFLLNGPKALLRAVEFLVCGFAFGAGRRAGTTQKVLYFQ